VGFCLETEDLIARAVAKRRAKGMDFIVANDPVGAGTFGEGVHQAVLIGPDGPLWEGSAAAKNRLALELLKRIAEAAW
jgi:phosphopantothenoylcysteine decarboxylase/phosphopantothenate--cysteine ligase